MSEETTVTNSHAVQRTIGTDTPPHVLIRATSHAAANTKQVGAANEEQLSPEILAFCTLLARIVMRCLTQRDAQVLNVLSLPQEGNNRQE